MIKAILQIREGLLWQGKVTMSWGETTTWDQAFWSVAHALWHIINDKLRFWAVNPALNIFHDKLWMTFYSSGSQTLECNCIQRTVKKRFLLPLWFIKSRVRLRHFSKHCQWFWCQQFMHHTFEKQTKQETLELFVLIFWFLQTTSIWRWDGYLLLEARLLFRVSNFFTKKDLNPFW